MSNHYHAVVHIRTEEAAHWSKHEVVCRSLYKVTYLSQSFALGEPLLQAQLDALNQSIILWRERLCSLSWFMTFINKSIARRHSPPILERLSLDGDSWLILTTQFERQFGQWGGRAHCEASLCRQTLSTNSVRK